MTNLLLIPTPSERTVLLPLLQAAPQFRGWTVELCGFGPIAAAARTAQLIADLGPRRVVLSGIAGTYGSQSAVGTAAVFDQVACYGVGAGTGDHHQTAGDLGWPQWHDDDRDPPDSIGDVIDLAPTDGFQLTRAGQLLTCCSASATTAEVRCRTSAFPAATAEDMEGFGVALACQLVGIPLQIARGISNVAGDRNKAHWQIGAALAAVAEVTLTMMAEE